MEAWGKRGRVSCAVCGVRVCTCVCVYLSDSVSVLCMCACVRECFHGMSAKLKVKNISRDDICTKSNCVF